MEALKTQEAKQQVATLMAAGYSIPATDALSMLGDAHATNYAENREFFRQFKERLKARFRQIDIWMTTHTIDVV